MSPMTGNSVMDLLLGKVAPTQQGSTSVPGIGRPTDGGFADILDMLFGNVSTPGDASALEADNPLAALLSNEQSNGQDDGANPLLLASINSGSATATNLAPIIVAGLNTLNAVAPETVETGNQIGLTSTSTATMEQPANSMLLPKEAVIPNPQVLALINQIPAQVPTGKFAVLSSKVTDGTLRMEIASQDSPNQKITLSLPTALLNQSNTPQSNPSAAAAGIAGQLNAGNRIPLTDPSASTERFDQLLSKVNVKEIEISPTHAVAATDKAANQFQVTMVAESGGKDLLLTGKAGKNQLTAATRRTVTDPKIDQAGRQSALDLAGDQTSSNKNDSAKSPVATKSSGESKLFDALTKSIDKNDSIAPQFSGNETPSVLTKGARQMRSVSATPVERPTFKMTLGQELPNLSQLEGRTLMIKLEPEFLGTARLHLTMRQDTLSARVMVETPQAKVAVESSLSQLTDQLAKAGIKVDYIDVGVRGGGAQNQFFHQPTNWFRARNSRMAASNELEPLSPAVSAATTTRTSASYIAGDRVNIYA